jgi:uncharacterized protein
MRPIAPASGLSPSPTDDEREAEMAGKFEVYEDRAGKYRFRLKAGNGEIVAQGEAYESKSAAQKGCESVQKAADGAQVVEV